MRVVLVALALASIPTRQVHAQDSLTVVCPAALPDCNSRVRFGMIGDNFTSAMSSARVFSDSLGRPVDLLSWFASFDGPLLAGVSATQFSKSQVPVVTWEPQLSGAHSKDDVLELLCRGKLDGYLERSAKSVRSLKRPVVVRFAHEMNGYWYPWGIPKVGDPRSRAFKSHTPATFKCAFRRVVDQMTRHGARNVSWMWAPNLIDATPSVTLASLFPGDRYVDIVGVSAYLFSAKSNFFDRYESTGSQIDALAPNKPLLIAETGVGNVEARAHVVAGLLEDAGRIARLAGVLWLNLKDGTQDFRLSPDDGSLQAAVSEIAQPVYSRATGAAFARVVDPRLTGAAVLGTMVGVTYSTRGTTTKNTVVWESCDASKLGETCNIVGFGEDYRLRPDQWHRCIRARITVRSISGLDSALTRCSDIVVALPPSITPISIDIRGTSVRLLLPPPPAFATHVVIVRDGAAPVYMPVSTSEYWFNGLRPGELANISLRYFDKRLFGDTWNGSVGLTSQPPSATYTVVDGRVQVDFPMPSPGQTGWLLTADDGRNWRVGADVAHWMGPPASRSTVLKLAALAGDAVTFSKTITRE